MSWQKVKLNQVLKQYRVQHIVQDDIEYKQVTISKYDGVTFRGTKIGKDIGRKRQFVIDLKNYPNTLMLVRQGVQDGSIGIAPEEVDGCVATENMPMFSVEGIDLEYLKFLLKSPYFYDELKKIETTGSAQKSIHERQILEIEIPLPNLEEQKKFVTELSKLKNGGLLISTELTHQLDLIKQLRQAFLREAMQGKLVKSTNTKETGQQLLAKIKAEKAQLIAEKKLKKEKELAPISEDEIPFDIPEHWAWCRLGEAVNEVADVDHKMPQKRTEGIPYISPRDFYGKNEIDFENAKKISEEDYIQLSRKIKPEKFDIIFPRYGTIGVNRFLEENIKFLPSYSCVTIKTNKTFTSPKYIFYYSISPFSKIEIKKHTVQTTQPNVGIKSILEFRLPLPPLYEQEQIVAKLEELMAFCDGLEQSIKESQGYNEMLLQQVLREALQGNTQINE